ncbi:MAG TPA: DUF4290 domain-containing protein [Bacteroidales bacterium]|nr:DUF4290 domain-containing protein [Bacteroidales bacterium]HOR61079.1 DUF4290 domain-containing protein [Bacteroidales bacterium]HPL05345.1 DUF4290 domain-containing protein [Bacteroidales bacterium]HPX76150.1 DUF4290 domain-containing protein [Bacteroidales bacterium]
MDYNTQRPQLKISEYGRTIQQMIDYACTIKDREERTKAAHTLVAIMGNMYPQFKDVSDFKHKLWDHLAIMSDFKLDIDWPYPLPDIKLLNEKPDKIPYSEGKIRYRHYGQIIQRILNEVSNIEEVEKREVLIEQMANQMKRSYMTWKKENISDDIIFRELEALTRGNIEIPEGLKLNDFREVLAQNKPNTQKQASKASSKKRSSRRKK